MNIIKNGEKGIAVTYDILGNAVLSFRSGGKYTYGILGFGYNHKISDKSKLVTEAGYGIHIPIKDWFRIDNEIKVTSLSTSNDETTMNIGYLLAPSFKMWRHYNLFGGASINYITSDYNDPMSIFPDKSIWRKECDKRMQQIYIGYQIGVQYIL